MRVLFFFVLLIGLNCIEAAERIWVEGLDWIGLDWIGLGWIIESIKRGDDHITSHHIYRPNGKKIT